MTKLESSRKAAAEGKARGTGRGAAAGGSRENLHLREEGAQPKET
eukprot:COSAG03_NODE_2405_length_2806_cov_5.727004_3_plen_45_part_00